MIKLGVNIDHVATLREARYRSSEEKNGESGMAPEPSVVEAARVCLEAGAHSITAHVREDKRHMQAEDVYAIRKEVECVLNLEMAVSEEMIQLALDLKPEEVCLVPENRKEVTTEGGLNVMGQIQRIHDATQCLQAAGIIVSLFIDPEEEQVEGAMKCGAKCIELHTGEYANAVHGGTRRGCLERLEKAACQAHGYGIQVNAGHGIHYKNVDKVLGISHLDTLNIGHAIISRSVFVGLKQATEEMLAAIMNEK